MSKAIIVSEPGGPDVLRWESRDVGVPGAGEVRLSQHAVGLNFIDVYHRTGLYPLPLPFTPGVEGAGRIEELGSDVEGFSVGDRVAYAGPLGAYAEHRLIAADRLVKLPETISYEQAAAVMLQGMTAQVLLRRTYQVRLGETILVHAAAGGTGLILCQWAAALGARVVGTVSTEAKANLAHANGCAHPIIYTQQDFVAEVYRITGGEKVSVVYDSVGADTFLRSLDCLKPRGLMVSFGQSSGPVAPLTPLVLSTKGSLYLTRPFLFQHVETRHDLEQTATELFEAVGAGMIRPTIDRRHALRNVAEAHRELEGRSTTGSTILII